MFLLGLCFTVSTSWKPLANLVHFIILSLNMKLKHVCFSLSYGWWAKIQNVQSSVLMHVMMAMNRLSIYTIKRLIFCTQWPMCVSRKAVLYVVHTYAITFVCMLTVGACSTNTYNFC